jgi:hypothetical protein
MFALWRNMILRSSRPYSAVASGGGTAPPPDAPTQNEGFRADAGDMRAPVAGVFGELSNALVAARATVANLLDLVSLEAQRAGLTLMWMVAWGLVAAVLIATAWLGLMVALTMAAIAFGAPLIVTIFVCALINLIAAAVLIRVCIGMSADLLFSATRRQVSGIPLVKAPAP